ncbi:MAG TPA: 3'-5' exonuclease [Candidatus Saccharimonadaceae bacterium]|nr:3'-5' exonuclease [Candidatus Saccharimonadaceae bacterium]
MALLEGHTVEVLDTETTGFDPAQGHELIEVARVTLASGAIAGEWSSLVRPARAIPRDASAVHGITDAMVAGASGPSEVGRALREGCGDRTLVFHNARFDLPFLAALLRGAGQPPFSAPVVDTLGLARGLFGSGGNSLDSLARKLDLPFETSHRALGDARTTARLFPPLVERWEREKAVRSLDELAAASQDVVRLTGRR